MPVRSEKTGAERHPAVLAPTGPALEGDDMAGGM